MARQLLVAQPRGSGAPLNGGLRNPTDTGPGTDAELERDSAPAGLRMAAAAASVAVLAMGLAVLPGVVAVGFLSGAAGSIGAGFGSLAVVTGGVKLTAVAWGLMSRLTADSQGRRPAASVD